MQHGEREIDAAGERAADDRKIGDVSGAVARRVDDDIERGPARARLRLATG
jgi:hypothetical protein